MNLKSRLSRVSTPPKPVAVPKPTAEPEQQPAPLVVLGASGLELEWKQRIHQQLLKTMDLSLLGSMDEQQARKQIREITQRLLSQETVPLSTAARQALIKQIEDEIFGLGPLEPLLANPSISDILVNGHKQVYVERRGKLEPTPVRFDNDGHLMNIIDRIVSSVGRRIDESCPMVDARLKDGSRVNAIIPPLAIDGPMLSIRRFSADLLGLEHLVKHRTLTPMMGELLMGVVKARLNVVVSGGTGSGKTTTLNVLSSFIPTNERIVTIEDSAELQLKQPHVVRLETRPPNVESKGQITAHDLVRNSLRMRPDRVVVGEVRGHEALDMLQAMNTGHDGSLTTIHANTPRDALTRLENMVAMTGLNLPVKAVRAQMAAAIDVIIQAERMEDGRRRLVSIQEINGMEGDIITMSEIFKFQRRGLDQDGNVLGRFRATGIIPKFNERLQQRGIKLPLEVFDPDRDESWEEN